MTVSRVCFCSSFSALALSFISIAGARAQVVSVQVTMGDGTDNAMFDGTALAINATSTSDVVAVYEVGAMTGFTNMSLSLTTTYDSSIYASGYTWGKFVGGVIDLRFDDGVHSYELTGKILYLLLRLDAGASSLTRLSGESLFGVESADLPANPVGGWPGLFSWVKNIAFDIDEDFTGYDWTNPAPFVGSAASQWHFIPESIPEPTTLAFLVAGALLVTQRRCLHGSKETT